MDREIRLSPDGMAVAIRTDEPDPESWGAWGVMHIKNSSHWCKTSHVADWNVVNG